MGSTVREPMILLCVNITFILCMFLFISYVLLHHVMGQIDGEKGAWGFVEGGMGSVSRCISEAALEHGATILTNKVKVLSFSMYSLA